MTLFYQLYYLIFFLCIDVLCHTNYQDNINTAPLVKPEKLLISTIIDPSNQIIVRDVLTLLRSIRLFGGTINQANILVGITSESNKAYIDTNGLIHELYLLDVDITYLQQTYSKHAKTLNKFKMFDLFDSTKYDYFLWLDGDIVIFKDLMLYLHMHQYPGEIECIPDIYSYMIRYPDLNTTTDYWNTVTGDLASFHLLGYKDIAPHGICNTGVLYFDSSSLHKFNEQLHVIVQNQSFMNQYGSDRFVDSLIFTYIVNKMNIQVKTLPYECNYMAFFEDELSDDVMMEDNSIVVAHLLSDTELYCFLPSQLKTNMIINTTSTVYIESIYDFNPEEEQQMMMNNKDNVDIIQQSCVCIYHNSHLPSSTTINNSNNKRNKRSLLREQMEIFRSRKICLIFAGILSPPSSTAYHSRSFEIRSTLHNLHKQQYYQSTNILQSNIITTVTTNNHDSIQQNLLNIQQQQQYHHQQQQQQQYQDQDFKLTSCILLSPKGSVTSPYEWIISMTSKYDHINLDITMKCYLTTITTMNHYKDNDICKNNNPFLNKNDTLFYIYNSISIHPNNSIYDINQIENNVLHQSSIEVHLNGINCINNNIIDNNQFKATYQFEIELYYTITFELNQYVLTNYQSNRKPFLIDFISNVIFPSTNNSNQKNKQYIQQQQQQYLQQQQKDILIDNNDVSSNTISIISLGHIYFDIESSIGLIHYSKNLLHSSIPIALESQLLLYEYLNRRKLTNDIGIILCCSTYKGLDTIKLLINHWLGKKLVIMIQQVIPFYHIINNTMNIIEYYEIAMNQLILDIENECNHRIDKENKLICYIIPQLSSIISVIDKDNNTIEEEDISIIISNTIPSVAYIDFIYMDVFRNYVQYSLNVLKYMKILSKSGLLIGSSSSNNIQKRNPLFHPMSNYHTINKIINQQNNIMKIPLYIKDWMMKDKYTFSYKTILNKYVEQLNINEILLISTIKHWNLNLLYTYNELHSNYCLSRYILSYQIKDNILENIINEYIQSHTHNYNNETTLNDLIYSIECSPAWYIHKTDTIW